MSTRTEPPRGGGPRWRASHLAVDAAIAVVLSAAALGTKWVFHSVGVETFYLPLVIPIAAAAWRGGAWGALVATAASAAGDLALFQPRVLAAPTAEDLARLAAFAVVGTTIGLLSDLRLRSLRGAAISRAAGERAQAEAGLALERLVGLEALLERLAPTTTPDQVADIVLADAVPLVGAATGGVVVLATERGRARVLTAAEGSPRTAEVAVHASAALADVLMLGRSFWEPVGEPSLPPPLDMPDALVPLRGRGPVIGALGLRWAARTSLDRTTRTFIEAVAAQCGQALERSLLFEAERHLRRDTEQSREEAVRLRDELRAVLQSIGEPILVIAPSGDVTLANRAAELLLGRIAQVDELRGRLLPADADEIDLEPGAVSEARLEGTDRVVQLTVFGVHGRPSGSRVLALRDVTDARRGEEAREVFIGVLSHELRTPVTTILAGIDLLSRPLAAGDRRAVMDDVAAESERLRRLVEDVLVLSRFERDALQVEDEPVLVHHMATAAANQEARRTDPPADVRVELGAELPPVRADATYLEQILRNLVGNAVKYGGAAGPVIVTAGRRDDRVEVVVADAGPGFPEADADRLFELFYRSRRTSSKPGAGIGLFVARQLARSMGGDLTARPRPGGGAEFILSLRVFTPPDEIGPDADGRVPERVGASADRPVD